MKIFSYSKQTISNNDIQSVVKTLKSNFLTQGPTIEKFENKVKQFVNSKYAVAVNSATSGLHLSCLSLGLKKNEYLWTVPNSFVASSNCALYCGANVDFVDINSKTFNIDELLLEKKLLKTAKKNLPKILVVVHFAGEPVNLNKIYKLSKKFKFKIIEDASHALGSKFQNNKIGNCKFSSATVFSFHPVKPITTGEGGIITTNNFQFYKKLKSLRSHGIEKQNTKKIQNKLWFYEQKYLGFNYRMNDIEASLGLSQLKNINSFLKKRNDLALRYKKKLHTLPLKFQAINPKNYSSYHLFTINLLEKNHIKNYNKIFNFLRQNNIFVQKHYILIYKHPFYRKLLGKLYLENSESFSNSVISLPLYPTLTFKEQDFIIKKIFTVLKKFNGFKQQNSK